MNPKHAALLKIEPNKQTRFLKPEWNLIKYQFYCLLESKNR